MEVVGAIIKNKSNEYLLQQRDKYAPSFKHHWTLFGGLVEQDETPKKALLRELNEEIDLSPDLIESATLIQTNTNDTNVTQYIFEVVTTTPVSDLTLREGEAMEYVSQTSLFDREFAFNIKDVLEKYIKQIR